MAHTTRQQQHTATRPCAQGMFSCAKIIPFIQRHAAKACLLFSAAVLRALGLVTVLGLVIILVSLLVLVLSLTNKPRVRLRMTA
jgi:hypothetical protein